MKYSTFIDVVNKEIKRLTEENEYLKEMCGQCARCSAYIPADEDYCENCEDEGFHTY
jgi:recombinational DNA repair protein RecR